MSNIQVILTSSVIAAILSAIVSAIVAIQVKKIDYKNEYLKKIIEKRLEAYKYIETQIALLKSTALGDDKKPYHLIFAYGEDDFHKFQNNLIVAMSYSIWISNDTVDLMEDLNQVFFKASKRMNGADENQVVEVGKVFYNEISILRKKLESSVKKDLLNLYDIKHFKRENKPHTIRTIYD